MNADVCPVCGQERINFNGHMLLPCGRDNAFGVCLNAERLAIERAAKVARLKDQLKQMADFFDHYQCLTEVGQSLVEHKAESLIASARETLNEKPNQEN